MQSNGQNCCGAGALSQDGDGADVGLSESVEISPIVADSEPQSKTSALSPLREDGIESTGKDDVGIVRNSKELVVGTLVESGKRPRSRSTVVSSSSSGTGLQGAILPVPCCRVDGCGEDLSTAGDYHRRHKVCKTHATATKVINHGQEQRFCQQCSRFHSLAEFDEGKRSCRKRLAGHNERRRRHQPETLASSPCSSSLLPVKEASKKIREWRGGGRAGRRGRPPATTPSRNEDIRAMVAKGEEMLKGETSSKHRLTRAGEDSYTSIFNDAIVEGENGEEGPRSKSKYQIDKLADIMSIPPLQCKKMGDRKDVDAINIDTADIEQMKEGLNLGDVVIPPLPFRRDGKLTLLKGWDRDSEFGMDFEDMEAIEQRSSTNEVDKKAWQKGDKETLLHCLWGCPKVQPVWRWAGRQLGKLKGSKVTLDWKQAIFGEKMEDWPSPEHLTVWKLFRSIILWQIWMARKGKVYSGIQCSPGKIIRAAWVDLTMYAMQDWLEVLKAKGVVQQEEMQEMSAKFDNKWLVNQFAGKRADWSVVWKEPNEVLLD